MSQQDIKLQILLEGINKSFTEVKSKFLKDSDNLDSLTTEELTRRAANMGELAGTADTLHQLGLIEFSKLSELKRMTNILINKAKLKDLIPSVHKHLEQAAVEKAMDAQDHATLLEMSKKAESCPNCKRIFVKAAAE